MNDPLNNAESEVSRDSLLQSTLSFYASGSGRHAEPYTLGWEVGKPDFSALRQWALTLILVSLIMIALWQLGL